MKNWNKIIFLNLAVLLLGLLPFLPGPEFFFFTFYLYSIIQIIALFGLVLVPIGLVLIGIQIFGKTKNKPKVSGAILTMTIPLTLFISVFWLSNYSREFSRHYAINQSEELIKAIEEYKLKNHEYPNTLEELTPNYIENIPDDGITGIKGFHYTKDTTSYKIEFYQNLIVGFNYEIVQYSPNLQHKSEGELSTLYDTKHPNWKYYVYD
ncbi:MAG: hypothetical protein ACR2MS_00370 [Weeksellaceae bacterium]